MYHMLFAHATQNELYTLQSIPVGLLQLNLACY